MDCKKANVKMAAGYVPKIASFFGDEEIVFAASSMLSPKRVVIGVLVLQSK